MPLTVCKIQGEDEGGKKNKKKKTDGKGFIIWDFFTILFNFYLKMVA